MSTGKTPAATDTRWPWHSKTTYKDGSVRENDYAADFDPAGFARHLSSKPNVAQVELTTMFVGGIQVTPTARTP
jgi:hypothetical protein